MQRELLQLKCKKLIRPIKLLKLQQSKPKKLPKKQRNLPRKRKIQPKRLEKKLLLTLKKLRNKLRKRKRKLRKIKRKTRKLPKKQKKIEKLLQRKQDSLPRKLIRLTLLQERREMRKWPLNIKGNSKPRRQHSKNFSRTFGPQVLPEPQESLCQLIISSKLIKFSMDGSRTLWLLK